MPLDFSKHPHRRYNILTGEWILVSPQRTRRPWQGKTESPAPAHRPSFDPGCYLCPGNTRAGGEVTPAYTDVFAFTNDFPALMPDSPPETYAEGLLKAVGERGICRVVCFSPDHALTLPGMGAAAIEKVVELWQEEYRTLGALPFINHVQIFENKGEIMGCSNPHPHGQIWAQEFIPQEVLKKSRQLSAHWDAHQRSLLADYLEQELAIRERLVLENPDFVALVPFWAVWPFETMILPRRHMQDIGQMTPLEKKHFADILKKLTLAYDQLFDTSFPYSSGIHQRPTDGEGRPEWHWHMAFYPPLLRSATVKKFMVGYEMFGNPQRDLTPETAAEMLRVFVA